MKKRVAIIILICLTCVIAVSKTSRGINVNSSQEESYVYVGGDLRGNQTGRLFSPYEVEGIKDGFEVRQCVDYGEKFVIAATKKSRNETDSLFYLLDKEKETIKKLTEITVAELYNVDGYEDGRLSVFVKMDEESVGSILELSFAGILSELELKDFPRAAALNPTQAWRLENKYLLVCTKGLFIFEPESGDTECVFENQERIYSVFRNRDGTLLFYTYNMKLFSSRAETCLYQFNEEFVPELVVKKDTLASFWPGTDGFCLMSSEDREDQLYKLNLETREESSFAYTGNIPMVGDYFYVSEDRLLFWRLDLPLGMARPAAPGEYQIINIAGWIPDDSSASSYQEYYTVRKGILSRIIELAILSGKEYIPCYTLYEGESGLKELKAALEEGFMPDILDTTWLPRGTETEYLMDLRPLFSDTVLENGLVLGQEDSSALLEFTPALILSAAYLDDHLCESIFSKNSDSAVIPRDKFLRLSAPLLYTLLREDGDVEGAAEIIAYASALPASAENTGIRSSVVLPLREHSLLLCGPVSFEEILNETMQICADNTSVSALEKMALGGVQMGVLPVFKMGIVSQIPEEKIEACIGFFNFCLTQRECVFIYDRVGVSLFTGAENSEQYENRLEVLIRESLANQSHELYLDLTFPQKFAQIVEACAAGNMTPEHGAKKLQEYVA